MGDGVTYGYSSYGDVVLELYDENASTDEPPYSYWGTAYGYPDGNASGGNSNIWDYVFVQPNQYGFRYSNYNG